MSVWKLIWSNYPPTMVRGPRIRYSSFVFKTVPNSTDAREDFLISIALFKRNALAGPFELGFKSQKQLELSGTAQGELMQIHYRDEEAIYVQASHDRVTVIFSTIFREETDRIFGKVFLQVWISSTHNLHIVQQQFIQSTVHNTQFTHLTLPPRNLSMPGVNPRSKMPLKSSTQTAIPHSKFDTSLDCATPKTPATSPSSSSHGTLPIHRRRRRLFPIFSCSVIICTIISSARRRICIRG